MKLLCIEAHGFKSFAEPTTLVFTRPKTAEPVPVAAIVGPNGSGKSNVVDAIRWVLGEQSTKTIRTKKSDDVIFVGSHTRARLGRAAVLMTLLNDRAGSAPLSEPHDDELLRLLAQAPEITIGRELDRSGNSFYTLCGKRVRLADIQLFLAHANFGQGSYAIIGQGTIDSLLTSNPKELRALFEEASGVKVYRLKRERAIQKLSATKENLHESDIRLQVLLPRRASLERQVERFRKRKAIEQELAVKRKQYYASRARELDSKYAVLDERLKQSEKERADCLFRVEQAKRIFARFTENSASAATPLEERLGSLLQKQRGLNQQALELARSHRAPSARPFLLSWRERVQRVLSGWKKLRDRFHEEGTTEKIKKELDALFSELEATISDKPIAPTKEEAVLRLSPEEEAIASALKNIEKEIAGIQADIQKQAKERAAERTAVIDAQQKLQKAQYDLHTCEQRINEIKIERARIEAHEEDLEKEIREVLATHDARDALIGVSPAPPETLEKLYAEIQKLAHSADLAGSIDPSIEEEYEQVKHETEFLETQIADLTSALQKTEQIVSELEAHITKQFDISFKAINDSFARAFTTLFDGGAAKLERTPKTEESEEGIEIIASPPGKRVKHLAMLSGGERTLAGIALICSIISHNAPPFVVLDEVDAALDEANTHRFADILSTLSKKTQFLIITHNRVTMEIADLLYGITMGADSASRLLSLHLADIAENPVYTASGAREHAIS